MSLTRTNRRVKTMATLVASFALLGLSACGNGGSSGGAGDATKAELNIATAAIPQTELLQKVLPEFEKENPGIKVKFTMLDEQTLRDKLSQQVATESGQFDAVMGAQNSVATWAKNGWLADLNGYAADDPNYDLSDLIPPIHDAVSDGDHLWAVPFTGESSYIFYRKDLFEKAGLTMPDQPTWDDIEKFAAELNDPAAGVAGVCLRGQASWGGNMPTITTMIHAQGGYLYDKDFNPGLDTPEATKAITQYVDMLRNSGEEGAANSSFQECYNLFNQGKAAIWYDSTAISGPMFDPKQNKFAADTAVAVAPSGTVATGGWLSTWNLAVLGTSKNQAATWKFIDWATSKGYVELIGDKFGWGQVPPGTRSSTYANPKFQEAASQYGDLSLASINTAKVDFTENGANALERSFYMDIPQWEATGDELGRIFAAAITGDKTVAQAIEEGNKVLANTAKDGGYAG